MNFFYINDNVSCLGKQQGPTVLQTRSKEVKERILTEKIAEILTGDEALSQTLRSETKAALSQRKPISIISPLLKEIEKKV